MKEVIRGSRACYTTLLLEVMVKGVAWLSGQVWCIGEVTYSLAGKDGSTSSMLTPQKILEIWTVVRLCRFALTTGIPTENVQLTWDRFLGVQSKVHSLSYTCWRIVALFLKIASVSYNGTRRKLSVEEQNVKACKSQGGNKCNQIMKNKIAFLAVFVPRAYIFSERVLSSCSFLGNWR